ncbi:MAG TPA: zinc dependent phospholipase C family protein [Anaeromyxobacteraceae bacterium]|nr:zinc dependent phospholipase C family protein [Anaeromyxobacteraceae bacterium]
MSDRHLRFLSLASLVVVALAIAVIPTAAHAWAPLAHLSFSARALLELGTVPAPTRSLLSEYANEFLYGSLAADIVVGKNLTRFRYHCHNWRVGFNVHRAARPGGERAFALGFLAHLAADTVAHNYFVPYQTVLSFQRLNTRHAYWELRYDQRMDRTLSRVARVVSGRTYRGHDELLRRTLEKASVLPFFLSRGLFGSVLASAREPRFQALSRALLARPRKLPLEDDLVEETGALAVRAILGLLREGERCEAARADATGMRNLRMALKLRKALKARRPRPSQEFAHALAVEARESFRRGITGPLLLPSSLARLAA